MKLRHRVAAFYIRIGRTYWAWSPVILLLAVIVFLPLGAVDALALKVDVDALSIDNGIKLAALALAVGAVATTSLLGEIFFSGAVAVSLTHPHGQRLPSVLEIARRLRYGRLIAVDILYVVIIAVAGILLLIPGVVIAFVFLGLSGAVVELEERTARGALVRSYRLVRGNFWFVFWILVPVEFVGDLLGDLLASLVHGALGHGFFASWLAESASNIVLSPVFAIAAVLLTIDLIAVRDEQGPTINHSPSVVTA